MKMVRCSFRKIIVNFVTLSNIQNFRDLFSETSQKLDALGNNFHIIGTTTSIQQLKLQIKIKYTNQKYIFQTHNSYLCNTLRAVVHFCMSL